MAETESFFVLRIDRPCLQWILASKKKQQIPHGLKPVRDDKK
jgi:hypothetical protein